MISVVNTSRQEVRKLTEEEKRKIKCAFEEAYPEFLAWHRKMKEEAAAKKRQNGVK
jgi:hypothetical protein